MVAPTKKINFAKLAFSDIPLSTEDSLKDVIPMPWAEEVLSGAQKTIMAATLPG